MSREYALEVPLEDRASFGKRPIKSRHNMQEMGIFKDQEIIDLLSEYPRSKLRVWSSGADPMSFGEWQPVETTGVSGEEMFECLMKGRLWINLQRIDVLDESYARMSKSFYEALEEQCPHYKVDYIHSYVLLSSPNAFVYLHLDAYENFFWCVRGGKKFDLYPTNEGTIIGQGLMEDICAGEDDFFEYRPEYGWLRREYHVVPGDMMSWPQHSPHQVFNNDQLNVGYGTFHGTAAGERCVLNYVASRYLRENMPWLHGRVKDGSLPTAIRRDIYRLARRLGLVKPLPPTEFWASVILDSRSPDGIKPLSHGPVLAECSRLSRGAT